jgi:hypothetical protein
MDQKSSSDPATDVSSPKANLLLYLTDRLGQDAFLPYLATSNDLNIRVIRKRRAEPTEVADKSFPGIEVYNEIRFAIWEEEYI